MTEPLAVVAYLRVSTQGQADTGNNLPLGASRNSIRTLSTYRPSSAKACFMCSADSCWACASRLAYTSYKTRDSGASSTLCTT